MITKFRQQLIKQELFTANVDIKSWLKALYKQVNHDKIDKNVSFICYNDNLFCQMLRFQK